MSLVATAGSASANSYTTVTFSDTYLLEERLGSSVWSTIDAAIKEAALIAATRELERESYKGERATTTQALEFPRYGIYTRGGIAYDSTTVPDDVQRACAELAFIRYQESSALGDDSTGGLDLSNFNSIKLNEDAFNIRHGGTPRLPNSVSALLYDFILTTQARLLRA